MKNKGYLESDTSSVGDERYTPFYAVEPILEFIDKSKTVWCPFDEEWQAYVQLLQEAGINVVYSSLSNGQDFFTYEPSHWDVMISNPPFSKKDKVLQRAYELEKPFALLLPANSIQGKNRFKIFKNTIQMLAFDERIGFHYSPYDLRPKEGTAFGSAYFCKDFLPTKLELRSIEKYDRALIR